MTDDIPPLPVSAGRSMTEAEFLALRAQDLQRRKAELLQLKLMPRPTIDDAKKFLFCWDNSSERPFGFIEVFNALFAHRGDAGECFWRWIMEEWAGFDLIPHAEYERLFRRYRDAWSADYMSAEDQWLYKALPARFVAYRGQNKHQHGLSWTLNPDVAAGFAEGHRGIRNPDPVILESTFGKSSVAFMSQEREEDEIVLFRRRRRAIVQPRVGNNRHA